MSKRINWFYFAICIASLVLLYGPTHAGGNLSCSCTGKACGNGAVGGDQGDIFTNVSPEAAELFFTPNRKTGWTCVKPAKTRGSGGPEGCYCKSYCGNGGIGADPDYFDLGLTKATIDSSYGGGKAGNKTGWLCGNWRGDFKPPSMACVCTGWACGNDAIGGDQGDIFTHVSVKDVKTEFLTNSKTGWSCFIPTKVRGKGGPKGCYCKGYCGNGGIGADPGYIDLGLSQSTVKASYGGGKSGNKTGWLCGDSRGPFSK